jgi:hypothetical protein
MCTFFTTFHRITVNGFVLVKLIYLPNMFDQMLCTVSRRSRFFKRQNFEKKTKTIDKSHLYHRSQTAPHRKKVGTYGLKTTVNELWESHVYWCKLCVTLLHVNEVKTKTKSKWQRSFKHLSLPVLIEPCISYTFCAHFFQNSSDFTMGTPPWRETKLLIHAFSSLVQDWRVFWLPNYKTQFCNIKILGLCIII